MYWLHVILMLAGGILAISGLIVAKKPDAKALIDKLVPFQAVIGVALLVVGLIELFNVGPINMFRALKHMPLFALTLIAATWGAILLGFLFGMPQIAKWIPGESSAETKALELSRKLAPIQVILGVVVLVAAVLMLLYRFRILSPF